MTDAQNSPETDTQWINAWLPFQDKIVSAITLTADALSGTARRKLHRLADEIAFVRSETDVLKNPLALEIFLNLASIPNVADALTSFVKTAPSSGFQSEAEPSDTSTESDRSTRDLETKIESAVNSVLLAHQPVQANRQNIITVVAYPVVVLGICCLVLGLISVIVVPTFQQMFDEFGLQLPMFTRILFGVSDFIQSPMTYVGLALFLTCCGLFAWLRWGASSPLHARAAKTAGSAVNLHGSGLRSTRGAWADWAWHVSLLMRAGRCKADAIEMAGAASNQLWLRRGSGFWADAIRSGENPFHGVTHFRSVPCHLLADALGIDIALSQPPRPRPGVSPATPANADSLKLYQAGVLRDIAEIYWDRDQRGKVWQLGWLSPLIIFGVGFIIWFAVIALFAPLVELITGLS
ncbi:Type II secretion system F domain protein [Rhodopirellula sp. ICT_H3.1]|uniref:Type II secretion system F domain protein n=1 Tax=Aporhodopirellula aestuarii TaxID=2950107 RepID=A0ABT0U3Q0_9BACT|nr:Type II secretion system F domain protein [Aporhodopirellula aestuarii]MCM2371533.1 Type II secretion system F domain protein [Aporhodopirellula aestuarii]